LVVEVVVIVVVMVVVFVIGGRGNDDDDYGEDEDEESSSQCYSICTRPFPFKQRARSKWSAIQHNTRLFVGSTVVLLLLELLGVPVKKHR
jgi:hypothetical protein